MIEQFVEQLKIQLQQPLPGEDVQFLMAPVKRERMKEIKKENYNPKKSAVMILIFPQGNIISTLFIERPFYDGVHSGQIAFPGGKFEEGDKDLKATALRETFEEIGVVPETIEIIGQLTDLYISPSNYLVEPYIGYLKKQPEFKLDSKEVQGIIIADLFLLNNSTIKGEKIITTGNGFKLNAPYYEINGKTIWGATAMMISELNEIISKVMNDTTN